MSILRQAVHDIMNDGLRSLSHPVQGYIPKGGIDRATNTCTVRIPNPHGGVQPNSDGNYIELRAIPLPFFFKGVLGGLLDLVSGGDRGVVVGFKGANMANPYIISPLPAILNTDKLAQTVDNRRPVAKDRTTNIGGSHQIVSPIKMPDITPQVTRFSDLTQPATSAAAPPAAQKITQFTSLQFSMTDQVASTLNRLTAPTIVPKK